MGAQVVALVGMPPDHVIILPKPPQQNSRKMWNMSKLESLLRAGSSRGRRNYIHDTTSGCSGALQRFTKSSSHNTTNYIDYFYRPPSYSMIILVRTQTRFLQSRGRNQLGDWGKTSGIGWTMDIFNSAKGTEFENRPLLSKSECVLYLSQ